jgi:hypothetical protein
MSLELSDANTPQGIGKQPISKMAWTHEGNICQNGHHPLTKDT